MTCGAKCRAPCIKRCPGILLLLSTQGLHTGETASAQAEPFEIGEVFRWGARHGGKKQCLRNSSVCGAAILQHDQRGTLDTLPGLSCRIGSPARVHQEVYRS